MELILLVLFGWLLGLLAPPIQDRIRQKYRARELRVALMSELKELKVMMAVSSFAMWEYLGPLTDDQLEWSASVFQEYDGPLIKPTARQMILHLKELPAARRRELFDQSPQVSTGPYPKEYGVPFLTAHIGDLSILPVAFQASTLHVKSQLDIFNQHVAFVQKRHDKTFDTGLSEANHQAILSDLSGGYEQLAEIAKRIVDVISAMERQES